MSGLESSSYYLQFGEHHFVDSTQSPSLPPKNAYIKPLSPCGCPCSPYGYFTYAILSRSSRKLLLKRLIFSNCMPFVSRWKSNSTYLIYG